MKHFSGIDGLRAWLAWTVVLCHIFLLTAADVRLPVLHKIDNAADHAVSIFIIISGFVITHLIVEKKEAYLPYITRRFLRIYPVYAICLFFGIFATWLHVMAFAGNPWGQWVPEPDFLATQSAVLQGNGLWQHLLAHITLLQGVIPNNFLLHSEYMFLGPAWSLSLEWQFYLVAPLVLFLLRYPWGKILVPVAVVVGYCAFMEGRLGDFESPAILPGAGLFFAVGMGTRLVIPKLPRLAAYPLAGAILAVGFIQMSHLLVPFAVWAAFVAWMKLDQPGDAVSTRIKRLLDYAFCSTPMRYLGERSYSTYLVHYPLIHVISFVGIKLFGLGMWPTVLLTLVLAPPLTLLTSILLYKYVEAPTIAYGKRLFNEPP